MFPKRRLRFQPAGEGVDQVLGELESQVMSLVWQNPGATARDIHSRLDELNLAYTTIVTILDRLHGKGLVVRRIRVEGTSLCLHRGSRARGLRGGADAGRAGGIDEGWFQAGSEHLC